jgi:hypothetical protein
MFLVIFSMTVIDDTSMPATDNVAIYEEIPTTAATDSIPTTEGTSMLS